MQVPHPLRLVVFDLAGTTVYDDDFVNRAFQEALNVGGLAVTRDEINAVMGYPKPQAIRQLLAHLADAGHVPDADPDALHADFLARMNVFYAHDPAVREIPGATATFRALRAAGLAVGLNTGFSRSTTDLILHRLGWHDPALVDATVASDEVERGRPFPDMIRRLMHHTGTPDAAQVVKVGDTPSDLLEGTQAGCGWVIGVASGSHSHAELAAYPHTRLIASVADLPALLGLPALAPA